MDNGSSLFDEIESLSKVLVSPLHYKGDNSGGRPGDTGSAVNENTTSREPVVDPFISFTPNSLYIGTFNIEDVIRL
jgi:hypothetical protein